MDFSPIIQRLNELTTFMNNVRTLSKKIFELPSSTAGNKLVAVYNETSLQTEKFNLTEALDGMYSLTNGITAIGNITRDGADFTFEVGFEWKINGIEYSNAEITRTINDAGTGNHRIDIAVCDTNNDIYIIEGFEVPLATAVVQPPTPPNTLFICYFLITESVIGDNSTPGITGQNNIPLKIEIASTDLSTNDVAGFVDYINALNPALTVLETNSLVQYYLTDTQEIYQFVGVGKGTYGLGQTQIAPENVMKITFSGGSQDLQQTLENGATFTALGKTLTIYSNEISIFDNNTLSTLEIGMGDAPDNPIFMIYTPTVGGQTELLFPKTESTENVAYQSYVDTGLSDKVDKVAGKQLSTEDYTTAEKSKLSGIASGATANDTDANLKNRANHTGSQAISTITGLQDELDKLRKGFVSSSAKSLVNTTSAQAVFDYDLNAESNTTYLIKGSLNLSGLATGSSTIALSLLGTAVISSFEIKTFAMKQAAANYPNMTSVQSNPTTITSYSTASVARVFFEGIVRVTTAGTIKPSLAFSSATSTMQVDVNAIFTHEKIGNETVTTF
jgi:hypothetical protein